MENLGSTSSTLHLVVHFWFPRDDAMRTGVLLSFSPKWVVFSANAEILLDQKIKIAICTVRDGKESCVVPALANITHVEKKDGVFIATATFDAPVANVADTQDNRRQYRRYDIEILGKYRQRGDSVWQSCTIHDIAQAGLGMRLNKPFKINSQLDIEIHPIAGSPFRKIVKAHAVIVRSIHRGSGIYHVGAKYINVSVQEPPTEAQNKAPEMQPVSLIAANTVEKPHAVPPMAKAPADKPISPSAAQSYADAVKARKSRRFPPLSELEIPKNLNIDGSSMHK